jgi:hypothetical protein
VLIDLFSSSSPKKDNAEPQSEKGDEAQEELPTLSSSSTFNFSSSGAHQGAAEEASCWWQLGMLLDMELALYRPHSGTGYSLTDQGHQISH